VLELIAQGKTSKQVADLLSIGVASVQTYRYKMKKKLRIKSNADLIKYALNKGYTSAEY
jgi:two-component system nitrate/nitrite response regulator NarL